MSQLILGLGNKARHGKDSFAAAIVRYYGNLDAVKAHHGMTAKPTIIQHLSFADALYKEVNTWLDSPEGKRFRGLGGSLLHKHYTVEHGNETNKISPAGLYIGKEGKPDVVLPDWVTAGGVMTDPRAPFGKYPKLLQWWGTEYRRSQNSNYWVDQWKATINPKADIVMSTDMRFENEADAVKKAAGYTVQVNRLNLNGTPFVDDSRDPKHISETQLDGYNYDYKITVKTGDLVLLEEWAVTLVHFLRARKGK